MGEYGNAASAAGAGVRGQFLTFVLAGEEYGIEILRVQEIRGLTPITPIPGAPAHVKGVMNLRGAVVPVIDLRARFGLPASDYGRFTVIIVVSIETRIVGLVVDAVSDALDASGSDIAAPPDFGVAVDTTFLRGMAKTGERLTLLLDIDRLIGREQGGGPARAASEGEVAKEGVLR